MQKRVSKHAWKPALGDLAEELEDSTCKDSFIKLKGIVLGPKTASACTEILQLPIRKRAAEAKLESAKGKKAKRRKH